MDGCYLIRCDAESRTRVWKNSEIIEKETGDDGIETR